MPAVPPPPQRPRHGGRTVAADITAARCPTPVASSAAAAAVAVYPSPTPTPPPSRRVLPPHPGRPPSQVHPPHFLLFPAVPAAAAVPPVTAAGAPRPHRTHSVLCLIHLILTT